MADLAPMRTLALVAMLPWLASCGKTVESIKISYYYRFGFPLPEGVSWDAATGVFAWHHGAVTLPFQDLKYTVSAGDSFTGYFRRHGEVIVSHDIGTFAGVYGRRKDAMFFEQRTTKDGARVCIAQLHHVRDDSSEWGRTAVSFPDSGTANFMIDGWSQEELRAAKAIADSYRPALPVHRHQSEDPCGK